MPSCHNQDPYLPRTGEPTVDASFWLPGPATDKRYASRRLETTTPPRRAARKPPRWRGSTRSLAAPRRPGLGQRPCSKARVKVLSPAALPRRSDARRNVQFGGSVVEVREICQVEPEPTATTASRDPVGTRKSLSVQARCYSGQVRPLSLEGATRGPVWSCWCA